MKAIVGILIIVFGMGRFALAQNDTLLKAYYVQSKLDEECNAEISVVLFDKNSKQAGFNQLILDRLMKGYYDTKQSVSLNNLYQFKSLPPAGDLIYTIAGGCDYNKGGIYSFVSCPYNVCDKAMRSNFESNTITLDIQSGKELTLYDIIDPQKKDSFENYMYLTAIKYHVRNIPSCYISNYHPIQITGSNNVTTGGDSVTYIKGLTGKFYLSNDKLLVYTKALHRDYNYNTVEVSIPLFYARYYLRKEMIERFGL